MTTPPPPTDDHEGSDQPTADLSELAATDALLDRLGARSPSEQDLLDPTALALNSLLADIDADTGADSAAARLVEVLAGRPLYLDGPSVAAEELIDLTTSEKAEKVAEPAPESGKPDQDDDETGGLRPVPITAARSRRWKAAAGKVTAPVAAASIAVMVLLGGGVSAAVTGSPLSPLSGVGSVVAKLPGVSSGSEKREDKLKQAQAELVLARELVASNPTQAAVHLRTAQQMLAELPNEDTADLDVEAQLLATQIPVDGGTTDPSVPGVTSVATTDVPAATPTADGPGTATPTVPVTAEPIPATTTSTPGTEPTTPTTTTTTSDGPSSPPPATTTPAPPATTGAVDGPPPSSSSSTAASSNSSPETSAATAPTGN